MNLSFTVQAPGKLGFESAPKRLPGLRRRFTSVSRTWTIHGRGELGRSIPTPRPAQKPRRRSHFFDTCKLANVVRRKEGSTLTVSFYFLSKAEPFILTSLCDDTAGSALATVTGRRDPNIKHAGAQ